MNRENKPAIPIRLGVLQLVLLYLFSLPGNTSQCQTLKTTVSTTNRLSKPENSQPSPKCELTTRDMLGPFFEDGAPNSSILAPSGEVNSSNTITLHGRVLNVNCQPLPGAIVHAWYAGGSPAHYTFPPDTLWYRGFVSTDKNGTYSFVATYPGTYSKRPIPHIHYKVISAGKEFVTQLYFPNDVPPSYQDYVAGRQSQFPSKLIDERSGKKITFDIIMDV